MNRIKVAASIVCLSLMTLVVSPRVSADDWNKETVVTFSAPFEIPGGITLPAGTYVFKLMDSSSNRNIVQVFSQDKKHLHATILAVNNYRLQTTDKTVMTFGERAAGSPEAIRSWFYPGMNYGQEFVYGKKRALQLAQVTRQPVLAMPDQLEAFVAKPVESITDEPVIKLKEAPLTAVKPTGEEVEVAQVIEPLPTTATAAPASEPTPMAAATPAQRKARADAWDRADRLPQTASSLPLLGLLGVLAIGVGFALSVLPKQVD
jgi:hypothetical protein